MKLSISDKFVRAAVFCSTGALFLALPYAGAQESESNTGSPPRPKVINDGMFSVSGVGYDIRYYFQEGKGYSDEDAHVYYSPSFKVSAGPDPENIESRSIKYHYDKDNMSLTLYFNTAARKDDIKSALRNALRVAAKKESDPNNRIISGLNPYIIAPLEPDYIVFCSAKELPARKWAANATVFERSRRRYPS